LITLFVVLLGIASGIYAMSHLGIETDITRLISPQVAWRLNEETLDRAFPQDVDLIAVVVDASSDALAADAAAALAQRLKGRGDLFREVREPDGGSFLRREGLLLLPMERLNEAAEQVRQSYPLFAALTHDPSLRGLLGFIRLALGAIPSHQATAEDVLPLLRVLSAGCGAVLKSLPGSPVPPLDWEAEVEHGPTRAHRRFILAQAVPQERAAAPAAVSLAFVRAAARDLQLTTDRGYRVRLAGRAAIDTEQLESVRKDSLLRFALSVALLLAVVLAALRSIGLLAATVATVLVDLVLTAAFAVLAVGELNLISMAFAVLFCGLSVDFTIQFGVAFRSVRARAASIEHALMDTERRVGGPIVLAAAGTASGFFAFLPTAFRGVAELGSIAGVGMLIAAALTLTFLPALYVQLGTKNVPPARSGARWFSNADKLVCRHRQTVLVGTAILAIIAAAVLPQLRFDADQLSLLDPSSEAVTTFRDLARDPDNSPFEVDVPASSLAAAQSLAQQLEALPEVDRAVTLASFVPDDQVPKLEVIQDAAESLWPALALAAALKLPPPDAAAQSQALRWMMMDLEQAVSRLWADSRLREQLAEIAASAQRVAQLEAVLLADPLARMAQVQEVLSTAPVALADLPEDLRREWVAQDGKAKISVFPKGDANDPIIRDGFVRAMLMVAPNAAGTPIQFTESARTVVGAFTQAGAYAIGAILLLVGMTLRRWRDTLLVLCPLLLAGLYTLATMAGLGLALDFANVIALPLLLGIGVAFDIYFVTNWRAGERHPLASPTALAVVFSALATGSAFGSLALSQYPGMSHMGLLLSIELCWTLACTLVVLPALLACVQCEK
jgi:hopanoid biosynthesis associated RND transporter like protein HpnN